MIEYRETLAELLNVRREIRQLVKDLAMEENPNIVYIRIDELIELYEQEDELRIRVKELEKQLSKG